MLGNYFKRNGDEEAPVPPPELPTTVKKRQHILGKSVSRSMPVRLEHLLPDINRQLESEKRGRYSQGAHFPSDDHLRELTQSNNTIPETVCAAKTRSTITESAEILPVHHEENMKMSTAVEKPASLATPLKPLATPLKPLATPLKHSHSNLDTISEFEKENFTPLKTQRVVSVTPASTRGPLSLLSSDQPPRKSSEDQNASPENMNPALQSIKKAQPPPSSQEQFCTPQAKIDFARSRLYATSGRNTEHVGSRVNSNLLGSVPLHPMLAAVQYSNCKQNINQAAVTPQNAPPLSHMVQGILPRNPIKMSSTKLNFQSCLSDNEKHLHSLKSLPDNKCLSGSEIARGGGADVLHPPKDASKDCSSSALVDGLKSASNAVCLSTVQELKPAFPVSLESNNVQVTPNPVDFVMGKHNRESAKVHDPESKVLSSDKMPTGQSFLSASSSQNPKSLPSTYIPSAEVNTKSAGVNLESVSKPAPKDENIFLAPKPLSSSAGKCAPGMNQITVNGKSYSVLSPVGRGGSSIVYQVLDTVTSKLLAIKCVNLSETDESICNGYLNEIKLLAQLQDGDCVIRMFDYEHRKQDNMLYVVMEKGDTDLSRLIKDVCRSKKISTAMIVYYWIEMLSAVSFIHKRGTIHSDLKPSNFLLVSGRLKLIDFGIASSVQGDMTSVFKDSMTGTYNYISPEALCGVGGSEGQKYKITYKSDVWSLGCILYNLVYGQTPFQGIQGQFQKLNAIVNSSHKIPFPPPKLEGCPPILIQALQACLMRNPKDRPSVDELLQLPYLGQSGPERQILSQISRLVASVEFTQETDSGDSNSPSSVLKAIQQIIIQLR